jgi:hypothetical protein
MEAGESNNMKPQEVVTIFRNVMDKTNEQQWIGYPELEEFFNKGFYIETFKQSIIDSERYMITFTFRKFNPATY